MEGFQRQGGHHHRGIIYGTLSPRRQSLVGLTVPCWF
jgi:hypothetical protein